MELALDFVAVTIFALITLALVFLFRRIIHQDRIKQLQRRLSGLEKKQSGLREELSRLEKERTQLTQELEGFRPGEPDSFKKADKIERDSYELLRKCIQLEGEAKKTGREIDRIAQEMRELGIPLPTLQAG